MRRVRAERNLTNGVVVGVVAVAVVTVALVPVRDHITQATPALAYVVPVVIAAIVGGRVAALLTAVLAAGALNFAFIPPVSTLKVASVDDGVALGVFAAIALVVGTLTAREADRRRAAEQRAHEIATLHSRYEAVVAERERLAEEAHQVALLSQVDEHRRALLRSVSHDLRTPLAAIRAAISDMRAGAHFDDATRDELLDVAGDEAERLDRLVANLLSLSQIEAGALRSDRQAVDLEELVADRVHRLSRLFRHVHVETDVPPDLPLVDADYSQIDQVVTNLLENAARHSPADSTIRVGARATDGFVEVWVADEGKGIDDAERDRLFEPFRPGVGSRSSGIGLAICRAIVEAHGGRIDVETNSPGGAVFRFTVPVRHG